MHTNPYASIEMNSSIFMEMNLQHSGDAQTVSINSRFNYVIVKLRQGYIGMQSVRYDSVRSEHNYIITICSKLN